MRLACFETIVGALHDAGVRYLVIGGVAVNAHGYIRYTSNIDLAVESQAGNINKALQSLAAIGYQTKTPNDAKAMPDLQHHPNANETSYALFHRLHAQDVKLIPVNIVTQFAFDFSFEYESALRSETLPGVEARFLSIAALIWLKQCKDSLRDRDDIQHLKWLQEDYSHIDENDEDFLWSMATFEGARKMQIIRNKKISVHERLEILDDLSELCECLKKMRLGSVLEKSGKFEEKR